MAAVGAFTSMDQAEDLKAFERRLVEYNSSLAPSAQRWRILLIIVCVCTAVTAWNWAIDQHTAEVSFLQSFSNHRLFAIFCGTLIVLILLGAHKRIMAQSIILNRSKNILADFNMSCDDLFWALVQGRMGGVFGIFCRVGGGIFNHLDDYVDL